MVTEVRETGTLIGSDKVEGTAVYGADQTKIGSIERVMIDKKSGRVSYAVLGFGGILGLGYTLCPSEPGTALHDPAGTFRNIRQTTMPYCDPSKRRPRLPWRGARAQGSDARHSGV